MIAVSNEWKELHGQRFLPESFVEINLSVADDTITEQYSVNYWSYSDFGNHKAIVHNKDVLPPMYYATLEENLWLLDGSRQIAPDSNLGKNPGYVSYTNKSYDSTTNSGSRYQITVPYRTTITPGLTITWSSEYDEYPTSFIIETLNGDVVADTITVTNNRSKISYVDHEFAYYTKLRITPLDWSMPNHKYRIDQIYFGRLLMFDKAKILNYTHEQTGDPLGGELSKNSVSFDIDNSDGRWDLLNQDNMTKYLIEKQPVDVRYGLKTSTGVEWITCGNFYLTEWKLSDDGMKVSFTARDMLEFMIGTKYTPDDLTGYMQTSALIFETFEDLYKNVATDYEADPIGNYGAGEVVSVSKIFINNQVMGYLTSRGWIVSNSCALHGNSARSMVESAMKQSVGTDVNVNYTGRLSKVEMPYYVDDTDVANFIQRVAHKTGSTMWQASDGTLHITSPSRQLSDYVVSTNFEYNHPLIELSKPLKKVVIKTYSNIPIDGSYTSLYTSESVAVVIGKNGDDIVVENPYVMNPVSDNSVSYIAQACQDWWKHRGIIKGEFRADPRLELFDVISVETKYGVVSPVMVTYIKYTYNGSFRCVFEGKILDATLLATASNDEITEVT